MKLVDANVLLYAVNSDALHHERSRRWLESALSGAETVAFASVALLAFLRLSTKVGLFPEPLTVGGAVSRVDAWLAADASVTVGPTSDHLAVIGRLLSDVGTGGNLVNDVHLAALAIEHRAEIVSFDHDFGRFAGVSWTEPPV